MGLAAEALSYEQRCEERRPEVIEALEAAVARLKAEEELTAS
jgi:hypothetical protein